jgi:exonuclease V gamma subunit
MPARLYFSNSLEILADHLIRNLADEGGDPFRAPALATPASSLRDWLKVRLAEKNGIAANIAFPHLENLLWDRLAERDKLRNVANRQPARLLDSFSFQGLVLAQLRRSPPPELAGYLRSEDPTDAARRLSQIAGRLAALFREYEYSRVAENGYRGLAESWNQGEACFGNGLLRGAKNHPARERLQEAQELEAWEMDVYRGVFLEGDGLRDQWGEASGVYRYTLPQYAEKALQNPVVPAEPELPVYHLFGLSNISPFHRNLIGRLADTEKLGRGAATFEIYALNPCAEFWEDALTPREKRGFAPGRIDRARVAAAGLNPVEIQNAEIADAPGENGLLSLLGKPGRETIKLWCQLTEYDFHEDFRASKKSTLLAAVQNSVLSRSPALAAAERVTQDDSLRIRSAPDARAEIELVRAEAAELLRQHPDLRPEDLAIIPADPEGILPVMRAVFSGGKDAPGNVPVLFPGAALTHDSPVLRAFRDLLSPAVIAADRNALLALLENPAVLRKAKMEPARAGAMRAYLEAAGFQEGWGALENRHSGDGTGSTALDAERRSLMALAMDPADTALEAAGLWPARDTTGLLERSEASALLEWLDSLSEALRPFRESAEQSCERTFEEWGRHLRALLDAFVEADTEDAADMRAEIDVRRFCTELGQWAWSEENPDRVASPLVIMLFEDRFREPEAGRAGFLRGGVRVGGLMALRGIPFRHVWVTGLSADTFPAPGDAAPLDLRAFRRMPGESDPAARDLYALLEVIAATTDSLTLSWPRREPARDAERSPSRALHGLTAWLESDVIEAGAPFRISTDGKPERPAPPPFGAPVLDAIRWAENPRAASHQSSLFADWDEVARYLRNPAEHAALRHFKLRPYDTLDFDEEERAATLFMDRWAEGRLFDAALRAELLNEGSGEGAFLRSWEILSHGGRTPPPPYDALEKERLTLEVAGTITAQAAQLRGYGAEAGLRFAGTLRCGPQGPAAATPPILNLPAFEGAALNLDLRIGGMIPWFFRSEIPGGGWGVLVEKDREFTAYLLQLCASALADADDRMKIVGGPAWLFVREKTGKIRAHALPDTEPGVAQGLLRDLLTDFATAPDFDDLDLERIESIRRKALRSGRALRPWDEEIEGQREEDDENPFAHKKMGARFLRALRTSVPEDAQAKIVRRLEPYLAWKSALKRSKPGAADEAENEEDGA